RRQPGEIQIARALARIGDLQRTIAQIDSQTFAHALEARGAEAGHERIEHANERFATVVGDERERMLDQRTQRRARRRGVAPLAGALRGLDRTKVLTERCFAIAETLQRLAAIQPRDESIGSELGGTLEQRQAARIVAA